MTNASQTEINRRVFDIASGMEDDLEAIRDFGLALEMMAQAMRNEDSAPVARIADEILKHADKAATDRGRIFDELHPLLHRPSSQTPVVVNIPKHRRG